MIKTVQTDLCKTVSFSRGKYNFNIKVGGGKSQRIRPLILKQQSLVSALLRTQAGNALSLKGARDLLTGHAHSGNSLPVAEKVSFQTDGGGGRNWPREKKVMLNN